MLDAGRANLVIFSGPLESSGGLGLRITLSLGEGCGFSGDPGWCLVKSRQCFSTEVEKQGDQARSFF